MFQGYNKFGNNLYISDIEITMPGALSESNQENSNFTIHPNPSNGSFTINGLLNETYAYEIYNSKGQLIQSETAIGNLVINLDNKIPGIYFVKINSVEQQFIEKIIIN